MKLVYRVLFFFAVFGISLLVMIGEKPESSLTHDVTVEMGGGEFPILYVESRGMRINPLHGYSSAMRENAVRDSISPVSREDSSLRLIFREDGYSISRLHYLLSDLDGEIQQEDTILAFDETDEEKSCLIHVEELNQEQEYALTLEALTKTNKRIYYYTRVKYLPEDYLPEKLEFILRFQERTMHKDTLGEVERYLEPNRKAQTETLDLVDIHSPLEMVGFGGLQPVLQSEIVPVIREITQDTVAVTLSYLISGTTKEGEENFQVKEYYRIRYTDIRTYLLDFERKMESVFNREQAATATEEIKWGITGEDDSQLIFGPDGKKLAFVKGQELWYLDLEGEKLTRVFSYLNLEDYVRSSYDQHKIRPLDITQEGALDFLVYGYLNGGDYEGRVAIVLYRYHPEINRIEERVYIPLDLPYQLIQEDIRNFAYVTETDLFYFALNHSIYCYDIGGHSLRTVAETVSDTSFVASLPDEYVAWQSDADPLRSDAILILNLPTGEERRIEAAPGERAVLYGKINEDFLYGMVEVDRISQKSDGSYLTPAYQVFIADQYGVILKDYQKKKQYVAGATVEGNIATLHLVAKKGNSYIEKDPDYIMNQTTSREGYIKVTWRDDELAYRERFLSLGIRHMKEPPTLTQAQTTMISEDLTLRLATSRWTQDRYYIYSRGEVSGYENTAAQAIAKADEVGGVVTGPDGAVIWARGDRPYQNGIDTVTPQYGKIDKSTLTTCVAMILDKERISYDKSVLTRDRSVGELLEETMGASLVNLTGCTVDEICYYIGKDRPVIGQKKNGEYVLFFGYDANYVKYADPEVGRTIVLLTRKAQENFEEAGSVFYTYQ